MDYHYFKTKLNRFYALYIRGEERPVFYDIATTLPELNLITQQFTDIKQEFDSILREAGELPRYHDIDPGESPISNATEKRWNVFMIYLLGYYSNEASRFCPVIMQLIPKIPNVIQVFFSILEPGKSIPLHEGPYLGYLRYHLGIEIPKDNPPHIVVHGQPYTWKEGEAVLFDDSRPHEVRNNSQSLRAVLIIDVLRPMPWLPHKINQLMTKVIARYTYGRNVIKRLSNYNASIKPLLE